MTMAQVKGWLGIYQGLEQRMLEIEQFEKGTLSLDEQIAMLDEYNELWAKVNRMNNEKLNR